MSKTTIIEAHNSNTVFENGKQKGTLGTLKGIFADYKNGTRNSDRLYSEELWDNRVFGSEDVMEALETKTLFGELDHPEGDRCETLAQNAAITITKLEKRPEEGVIYGEAEILDTPTGRIVKALADSGAKLGISSRGMGEEIYENGQNIIDPETYDFITFDVVVTPANTKARVSLAESKHIDKLTESLKKEITEAETSNQLDQLKTVVESMNVSNKNDLLKMIEQKIQPQETESKEKVTEANKRIVIEMLTKQLDESVNEIAKLQEENAYYKESKQLLKSKVVESNKTIKELTENNTKLTEKLQENESNYNETLESVKKINSRKLESKEAEVQEEIESLKASNKELEEKLNKVTEQNEKLLENENQLSKILMNNKNLTQLNIKLMEENKKYKVENVKLQESIKAQQEEATNKLTESKQLGSRELDKLKQQIKSLQEENEKLTEAKERLSKVSFNRIGEVSPLNVKDFTEDLSVEEINLFNALTHK